MGQYCSAAAQGTLSQQQSAGNWAGLEDPRRLHSHCWCLSVPPHGCSLSTWLVWASSQHGGLRIVGFLIGPLASKW